MKIECVKEKLQNFISKADKITGKNLTLPILSCLYLEAKGNSLKIKATNLDLGLEIDVPVKIEKEGSVAVPSNILCSFLSNLYGDRNIKLESDGKNLNVSTQTNKTSIKLMNQEEFPIIPFIGNDKIVKINPKEFTKGLKSVWYSSSVSSIKPELSSVYIYSDNGMIVFAATDSFRLAEKRIKIKTSADFPNVLIPFKNIAEIIRILEDGGDEMEVRFDKNQIAFIMDGVYLTTRVIDGVFPDYKQIIPKEFTTESIVLKQDIVSTLKLANVFSDKFNQINIKIAPESKHIEFQTKNMDVGESVNKVSASSKGDGIEINFNYKYIMDCFQSINSDNVSLFFNGTSRPMVIQGLSDKTFTYLVMPMNK